MDSHISIHLTGRETFRSQPGKTTNHASITISGEGGGVTLVLGHNYGKAENANYLHNLISELTNLAHSLEVQDQADVFREGIERTWGLTPECAE